MERSKRCVLEPLAYQGDGEAEMARREASTDAGRGGAEVLFACGGPAIRDGTAPKEGTRGQRAERVRATGMASAGFVSRAPTARAECHQAVRTQRHVAFRIVATDAAQGRSKASPELAGRARHRLGDRAAPSRHLSRRRGNALAVQPAGGGAHPPL